MFVILLLALILSLFICGIIGGAYLLFTLFTLPLGAGAIISFFAFALLILATVLSCSIEFHHLTPEQLELLNSSAPNNEKDK